MSQSNRGHDIKMPLLTEDEHEALALSGRLASLIAKIIGDGPNSQWDWAEAAASIHHIQHSILAQAAGRAYPDLYRLLGTSFVGADP